MFSQIATIAPIFLFLQSIDLTNSYLGLVIPYTTFALPLAIWNFTTYYRQIPFELEESAKVDGASIFQRFWHIILPLVVAGMFTTPWGGEISSYSSSHHYSCNPCIDFSTSNRFRSGAVKD